MGLAAVGGINEIAGAVAGVNVAIVALHEGCEVIDERGGIAPENGSVGFGMEDLALEGGAIERAVVSGGQSVWNQGGTFVGKEGRIGHGKRRAWEKRGKG